MLFCNNINLHLVFLNKSLGEVVMKIGIVGYGNLGKSLESISTLEKEFELVGVFSRRKITAKYAKAFSFESVYKFKNVIDCLLLAGGSSSDLPLMSPSFVKDFNIIDSFDKHSNIREHFEAVDESAKAGKHVGIISCGWDPGLLSVIRLLGNSFISNAETSTFWGKGVSQGHSEAIKRIQGVKYAVQYTVPKENAMKSAINGEKGTPPKESHIRECYVVSDCENKGLIEEKIKAIPEYFSGYETYVNFITEEEFFKQHNSNHHGGRVISFGKTNARSDNSAIIDFKLKISSNPDFTARIMLAYARAAKKLSDMQIFGAKTPLDIPPSFLLSEDIFSFM